MLDDGCRRATLRRVARLRPASAGRWGTLTAPRMVTHLIDQMRAALGDLPTAARPGIWRLWPARLVAIYLLPWPRGIRGPEELFVTEPTTWDADVKALERLIARFAARDPSLAWPDHPMLGRMSGRDWGVFTARHFDHHLRQFGV